MFQSIFAYRPWLETSKTSFSRTNQTANKQRRQKKPVKIFLNFTCLQRTHPGQKAAKSFQSFLKKSRQMFGYPGLDAVLNISRFPEVKICDSYLVSFVLQNSPSLM